MLQGLHTASNALFPEVYDEDVIFGDPQDAKRRSFALSNTWHHPNIQFPDTLVPLKPLKDWYPLLGTIGSQTVMHDDGMEREEETIERTSFTASNGLTITNLTSTSELLQEHKAMDHCVDGYTIQCCEEDDKTRSHIFSVRDQGQYIAM